MKISSYKLECKEGVEYGIEMEYNAESETERRDAACKLIPFIPPTFTEQPDVDDFDASLLRTIVEAVDAIKSKNGTKS